jgi:hypothetical protein
MHNCFRYRLEWLGEVHCDAAARAPLFPHLPSKGIVDETGQRWTSVMLF